MLTMQVQLNIDAQKFVQQVQTHNTEVEEAVQKGLDAAFAELAKEGAIESMIKEAVKKNVLDSFSRYVFQNGLRTKLEKQLTEKMGAKIDAYTDTIVNELADKMNIEPLK